MKRFSRRLVQLVVRNEILWKVGLKPYVRLADSLRFWRTKYELDNLAYRLFHDRVVLHGPFKGMQYSELGGLGGAWYPRLLGSYESEIHHWIETIRERNYTQIVDVGCAEGYYAVGFARMFPLAQVFAFDTDPEAQTACQAMTRTNGVDKRVKVVGRCNPPTLTKIISSRRALIVSDCEGYERELFTAEVAHAAARSDILVEIHDFGSDDIAKQLINMFEPSHQTRLVTSVSPAFKATRADYPELSDLSMAERLGLLDEHRGLEMKWFIAEPRQ